MSADPAFLWPGHRSTASTFEGPTRGVGRKLSPNRVVRPGERVRLVDRDGPGRVTHLWFAIGALDGGPLDRPAPEVLRAQVLEVRYDDRADPSVSVPVPDWFGAVHGRPVAYASALTAVNEGRGWSSRVPLPFRSHVEVDWVNRSSTTVLLYFQADVLLGPVPDDTGVLHASFRREDPTIEGVDFTVTAGLRGPGRFLGWTGGVRVLEPHWWGEGEVKVFDGPGEEPIVCGTGFEDHLDSAWCLGEFAAPETGAPLVLAEGGDPFGRASYVSWYRWHLSDPVVFAGELRVTAQQIGSASFPADDPEGIAFRAARTAAGTGWMDLGSIVFGLYERSDDWCATAFAYCSEVQAVEPCDVALAAAHLDDPPPSHRHVTRPTRMATASGNAT